MLTPHAINSVFLQVIHERNLEDNPLGFIDVGFSRLYKIEFYKHLLNRSIKNAMFECFESLTYGGFIRIEIFNQDRTVRDRNLENTMKNLKLYIKEKFIIKSNLIVVVPTLSGPFDFTVLYMGDNPEELKEKIVYDLNKLNDHFHKNRGNESEHIAMGGLLLNYSKESSIDNVYVDFFMTGIHSRMKTIQKNIIDSITGNFAYRYFARISYDKNDYTDLCSSKLVDSDRYSNTQKDAYDKLVAYALNEAYKTASAELHRNVIYLATTQNSHMVMGSILKNIIESFLKTCPQDHAPLTELYTELYEIRLLHTGKLKTTYGDAFVTDLIKDIENQIGNSQLFNYNLQQNPLGKINYCFRIDKDRWLIIIFSFSKTGRNEGTGLVNGIRDSIKDTIAALPAGDTPVELSFNPISEQPIDLLMNLRVLTKNTLTQVSDICLSNLRSLL